MTGATTEVHGGAEHRLPGPGHGTAALADVKEREVRMSRSSGPGAQTVLAAQEGDEEALENLLSEYLPLIYNIVGRGLNGHADVDDVVQETMLRVVRSVRDLRDPEAFRSWLVAVAIRQMHDHRQQRQAAPLYGLRPDVADPGADFVDLTLLRLGLSGQRRETAQATRWLDGSDHDLLALWWLEAGGELERGEIAAALGLTPSHAAVRIARMKEQLAVARVVVRALQAVPLCAGLADVTADWDQAPSPLWRKRIARHTRDCPHCAGHYQGLIPAERLLAGLPLITAAGAAGGNWLSGNWLSGNWLSRQWLSRQWLSRQWLTRGSQAQSPRTQAPGRQAPSPAGQAHSHGRPPGWLDQFMQGAAARGYRVNFITVHWYGADFKTGPAVQQLESYLQAIYNRYHLPIWLTEFALANFGGGSPSFPTESQQAAFLTAAATMLEHLSYVQRYAWFGLGSSATDGSMGLFGSGPVATTVGRAFEAVDAAR